MTTIAEDTQALNTAVAEIMLDKDRLLSKCKGMIEQAESLAQRVLHESPERAADITPLMDGLKSSMASLCGQLQ